MEDCKPRSHHARKNSSEPHPVIKVSKLFDVAPNLNKISEVHPLPLTNGEPVPLPPCQHFDSEVPVISMQNHLDQVALGSGSIVASSVSLASQKFEHDTRPSEFSNISPSFYHSGKDTSTFGSQIIRVEGYPITPSFPSATHPVTDDTANLLFNYNQAPMNSSSFSYKPNRNVPIHLSNSVRRPDQQAAISVADSSLVNPFNAYMKIIPNFHELISPLISQPQQQLTDIITLMSPLISQHQHQQVQRSQPPQRQPIQQQYSLLPFNLMLGYQSMQPFTGDQLQPKSQPAVDSSGAINAGNNNKIQQQQNLPQFNFLLGKQSMQPSTGDQLQLQFQPTMNASGATNTLDYNCSGMPSPSSLPIDNNTIGLWHNMQTALSTATTMSTSQAGLQELPPQFGLQMVEIIRATSESGDPGTRYHQEETPIL